MMQCVELQISELFQLTFIQDVRTYQTACLMVVVRHVAILRMEERSGISAVLFELTPLSIAMFTG
jgi:hypothetical protein